MAPQPDPNYTVLVRLPFPRGDFVDPPPVEWNATKDRELWNVLSQTPNESDIDWKSLAAHFDISLPFLLQQAAWLYHRRVAGVRAQVRKVGNQQSTPSSQSPLPPSSLSGSHAALPAASPMVRAGSGSGVPSRLSIRERRDGQKHDTGTPPTPVNKTEEPVESKPPPRSKSPPRTWQAQQRRYTQETAAGDEAPLSRRKFPKSSPSHAIGGESSAENSSSESSSDSKSEGLALKRYGPYSVHRSARSKGNVAADEEDEPPAFLPAQTTTAEETTTASDHDMRETLRQPQDRQPVQRAPLVNPPATTRNAEPSETSSSSGMAVSSRHNDRDRRQPGGGQPETLSPQRATELSQGNTRRRGGRGTSEDDHSMGSSFSDLDDTSVTQSALEEALLSNMQHGSIASRMSTISQALRSRYLT